MLIDKTYFTGSLELPNIEQGDVNSNLILNNDKLDRAINQYCFVYLVDVFGVSIAKEILDVIEPDGTITPGTDQKYIDLIDGVVDWLGLRYEIQGVKYSQIANFVYCQYLRDNESQLSNLGNSLNDIEKGQRISSWNKFNEAWREMFKLRQPADLIYYGYPCDYEYQNNYKTLYEYLTGSEDWNTDKFIIYHNTNIFDI
jgi:hypothetical protein